MLKVAFGDCTVSKSRNLCSATFQKMCKDKNKNKFHVVKTGIIESDQSFLSRVVKDDEILEYKYDPQTKGQSSKWSEKPEPRPKN